MERNEPITDDARRNAGESPEIEERFLNGGERSRGSMEEAAEDAFVEDQRDPDHPSRRQRELDREHGIENPSHSRGI
jgi:hypothetical protein